jgi:hypothetical protein
VLETGLSSWHKCAGRCVSVQTRFRAKRVTGPSSIATETGSNFTNLAPFLHPTPSRYRYNKETSIIV